MANLTIFKVEEYNSNYFRIFSGVYNDFKMNAVSDYNFELEPLSYPNFIKSIEDRLLKCLVLFEDNIPTGFLAYTTLISESLELNIIHCIGNENLNAKRKVLLDKFIEVNKQLMREKVVTYPLLGKQSGFAEDIQTFGFKIVNTSVMGFNLNDISAINKIKEIQLDKLPQDYSIANWKSSHFKDAVDVIHNSFKETTDALFDSRFLSGKGCRDIIEKITGNVYGKFLPEITKVLLYKKRPVGFCFANLTNDKIANVPIVALLKKHRNMGFGKYMLKHLLDDILNTAISEGWALKELNASCDADNQAAVKMYQAIGFTEEYSYPQAYHPKTGN